MSGKANLAPPRKEDQDFFKMTSIETMTISSIEQLRSKREELNNMIMEGQARRAKIQSGDPAAIEQVLAEKLESLDSNIAWKQEQRTAYDSSITQTEAEYKRLLDGSQTLLKTVRDDSENLKNMKPSEGIFAMFGF